MHRTPPNLPIFFGREETLKTTLQRLSTERVVCIAGTAGVGKTALGQVIARLWHEQTEGVVLTIDAQIAPDLERLASAFSHSLRLDQQLEPEPALLDALQSYEAPLLIIDNAHLLSTEDQEAVNQWAAVTTILLLATEHLPAHRPVTLAPLDDRSVQRILELYLSSEDSNLSSLVKASYGLPLAAHLIGSYVDVLGAEAGTLMLDLQSPDSGVMLRELVELSFSSLPKSAQNLLLHASGFSKTFDAKALTDLSGAPVTEVAIQLKQIWRACWLQRDEKGLFILPHLRQFLVNHPDRPKDLDSQMAVWCTTLLVDTVRNKRAVYHWPDLWAAIHHVDEKHLPLLCDVIYLTGNYRRLYTDCRTMLITLQGQTTGRLSSTLEILITRIGQRLGREELYPSYPIGSNSPRERLAWVHSITFNQPNESVIKKQLHPPVKPDLLWIVGTLELAAMYNPELPEAVAALQAIAQHCEHRYPILHSRAALLVALSDHHTSSLRWLEDFVKNKGQNDRFAHCVLTHRYVWDENYEQALQACESWFKLADQSMNREDISLAHHLRMLILWAMERDEAFRAALDEAPLFLQPIDCIAEVLEAWWQSNDNLLPKEATPYLKMVQTQRAGGDVLSLKTSLWSANRVLLAKTIQRRWGTPPTGVIDNTFLIVEPEGRFRVGGDDYNIAKYHACKSIFEMLVSLRVEQPGVGVNLQGIVEAGWPGERLLATAARNRAHVELSRLRRCGLQGVLIHRNKGWLLDPQFDVRVHQAES